MHRILAVLTIIIVTQGAPVENEKEAKILKYDYNTDGKGNYIFSFTTSNGIQRSETGTVMDEGLPTQYILVEGRVSYTSPDGEEQSWTYKADKYGYHQEPIMLMPQVVQVNKPLISGNRAAIPDGVFASLLG